VASKAELALILSLVDQVSKVAKGIKGELGDVGKAGKDAKLSLADIGKGLAKVGGAAVVGGIGIAVAGITGAVATLSTTIGPASDLAETVSKVGVVFGDQADRILAFGETAARSMGMTKEAALSAAGTYGNLFRSMDMAETTSADMSTGLVSLAADLASFNNMDPTEVLDKLRAGLTGETTPLKALGVNINADTIKAKAMEMGLVGVGEELSASAKAQASYALIMKQTSLAQGDFARTSDGLANQQRILKASMSDLKATVGTAVLPVVQNLAGAFSKLLQNEKVQGLIKTVTERLSELGQRVSEVIDSLSSGDLAGALTSLFGEDTAGKIMGVAESIGEFLDKVQVGLEWLKANQDSVIAGFAAAILTVLVPAFISWAAAAVPAAIATIAALAPILAIVAAVGLAVGLLVAAWKNDWGGIRTYLTSLWEGTLKPIFDKLVEWLQTNIPIALEALSGFWENTLLPAIQTVANWITGTLLPILSEIWTWLSTTISGAIESLSALWTDTLQPALETVWGFIQESVLPLFESLAELFDVALTLALTALAGLWENVLQPALETVWLFIQDNVFPLFEKLGTFLSETFTKAIDLASVALGVLGGWFTDTVVPALEDAWDWLGNKLSPVVETVTGLFDKAVAPLRDLSGVFATITEKVQGFKDKLANLSLPAWLTPGSPTPLETAMWGLGDALNEVVNRFIEMSHNISVDEAKTFEKMADGIKDMSIAMKGFAEVAGSMAGAGGGTLDFGAYMDWLAGALETALTRVQELVDRYGGYNDVKDLAKLARRLREVLDAVIVDLSGVKESELGSFLLVFVQLREIFDRAAGMIHDIRSEYGERTLRELSKLQEPIAAIMSLGKFDGTQVPVSDAENYAQIVDAHFSQLETVLNRATDWLGNLSGEAQAIIAKAAAVAPNVQAVAGVVSAIDPTAIIPSESETFEQDVDTYFQQQQYVGSRAIRWLSSISETWRKALEEAAPVVQHITAVLGLGGTTKLDELVPSESDTFEEDVDQRFQQQEYVGSRAIRWLNSISETWRKALAAVQPVVEYVKSVLSLGGNDLDAYVPAESATFEQDARTHFDQLRFVGGLIVGWLSSISEPWRKALAALGPVAEDIKKVFSITEVGTGVNYVDSQTFISKLVSHLNALIAGTPLVKRAIETIKGQWTSLEAMAEDAGLSETIKKFFSILDLAKTLDELTIVKKLGTDERRTALSNVITNFIDQMKIAAPMLKDGLAEVEALFDGALESSTTIAEKLSAVFEALSKAIKAGIEMTTAKEWNLGAVLRLINELATAAAAVSAIQLPALAVGAATQTPTMTTVDAAAIGTGATSGDTGTKGGGDSLAGIREAVRQGIIDGLRDSVITLDVGTKQSRKQFPIRLGQAERLDVTLTTAWDAGGA
jgi:hypothetical protein